MQVTGGGDEVETSATSERSSRWADAALLIVSLLVSLVLIEIGYRAAVGLPAFKLVNWRAERIVASNLGELKAVIDPVLGWTSRPSSYHEDGYTTLEHGIRKNFHETTIRTGGMLAVGDSFTEGWEVKDHESWPAMLEQMTRVPVVNAGVGGYGTDQIVLRAEQLLPIIQPKILIVGFLEADIDRAGHSIFGAPKPHFTITNGELQYHPPKLIEPHEKTTTLATIAYGIRGALGYSAAADHLFARLNPNYWYGDGEHDFYQKVDIDEAAVTCALLKRLQAQAERNGIRTILFMQYHASVIVSSEQPPRKAQEVLACAQAAGFRVADQFAFLRSIAAANAAAMKEYYVQSGETYGHMSPKGNHHAAHLLSQALREWIEHLATDPVAPSSPVR